MLIRRIFGGNTLLLSIKMSKTSKIFTNQFKYFDYDIIEETEGDNAEVIFKSKNLKDYVRAIIYKLELRESGWVVVGIEFRKNEN